MTKVVVAMLALSALAQPTAMTVNDVERHRTITVTAVGDDIVRIDVVPEGWSGERLPSLALDRKSRSEVKINEDDFKATLKTANGLTVSFFKSLGLIKAGCGETDYLVDVMTMRDSSRVVLMHNPGESFYGAGERGYSFNLTGDTLVNYNAQN